MKIFRLEPKNLDFYNWTASVYDGVVIVRAEDEMKARRKAAFKFSIAVEIKSNAEPTPISPWIFDDCVDCKEEIGSIYPIDGDVEILYPNL
jgi:hypothetical protein